MQSQRKKKKQKKQLKNNNVIAEGARDGITDCTFNFQLKRRNTKNVSEICNFL